LGVRAVRDPKLTSWSGCHV